LQVEDPARTTTYPRQNFVAFDRLTGVVSPLILNFDGLVTAIVASDDGTALYISGAFAKVNGITHRGLVKYDLVNGQIDPTFKPTAANRTVSDVKLVNGSVIAVGNFTKQVVALDPTTGADTGSINITVTGVIDPNDETRVRRVAISPDGTRLVATGNFATVNGQSRKRAFALNLGATATLNTWHAPRFDVNCRSQTRQTSAQGVDFSPDGTYFVIVATGGPTGTNGVCDAAARFETADVSGNSEPTWINWTGGDTLYSVAVTGPAVYVGGHQRWLDNPFGNDSAGPGAVSRPGIGAIDPVSGKALPWNPTKSRNHGTTALIATPTGLWVGSDGTMFGKEYHAGIGFAPLDVGAPDTTRPNTFIDSGPSGTVTETSATFTFSANEPATFQCRLDGAAFAPCTSPAIYSNLATTSHSFEVAAADASYNVDASPAARTWTVSAHAPVANPQSVSIGQDTTTSVTLTGSDPDNDPLQFKVTALPVNGDLYDGVGTGGHLIAAGELPYALTGTGNVATYQPAAGFAGADSFAFVANDGQLDSTAAATVSISVGSSTINLIGNPGFESNTSGWQTEASANSLTRVGGAHSGSWAAQLSNSSAGVSCGLDDKPSWVSVTQAGAYNAGIWVRSDTPGLVFKLRIREYRSGVQLGLVSTSVTLTSSWQQVTAVYTPVAPGQSFLDFEGFVAGAPVGVCFQADDASITH
jgi:hypothetical protein